MAELKIENMGMGIKMRDDRPPQTADVKPVGIQAQVYVNVEGTAKVKWEDIVKDVIEEFELGRGSLSIAKKMAMNQESYVSVWVSEL